VLWKAARSWRTEAAGRDDGTAETAD